MLPDPSVQREIANLAGLHQLHLMLHSDSNHLLYCTLFCVSACAEQGMNQRYLLVFDSVSEMNRRELRRLGTLRRVIALLPASAQDRLSVDSIVARHAMLALTAFTCDGKVK